MKFLIAIIFSLFYFTLIAQEQREEILFPHTVHDFTVDENENIYTWDNVGNLQKYDESLKQINEYRSINNGPLHSVDASNPLQVLLNYSDRSKLVILDRMMTPKLDLDLTTINIFNPKAIVQSKDGNIWIYDKVNMKLKKVNEQMETIIESNDLMLYFSSLPEPTHMEEHNDRVIMSDPNNGIYIFDRYANFIQKLEILGVETFQLQEDKMIYTLENTLFVFDLKEMKMVAEKSFPMSIVNKIRMTRNHTYILSNQELLIQ